MKNTNSAVGGSVSSTYSETMPSTPLGKMLLVNTDVPSAAVVVVPWLSSTARMKDTMSIPNGIQTLGLRASMPGNVRRSSRKSGIRNMPRRPPAWGWVATASGPSSSA